MPEPVNQSDPNASGDGEGEGGHSNDQGKNDDGDNGGEGVRDPEAVARNNVKLTDELKKARSKITKMEKDAEKGRQAQMTEHEKAIDAARKEAAKEVEDRFATQITQERILARAAGVLVDPDDAVLYISVDDLDDNSPEAIDAAIEELVKSKPHLRAKGGRKGINQGPQGEPPTGDNPNDWIRRSLGRG